MAQEGPATRVGRKDQRTQMVLAAGQGEMKAGHLPSGQRHWVSAPYQKSPGPYQRPLNIGNRFILPGPCPRGGTCRAPHKGLKMTHPQTETNTETVPPLLLKEAEIGVFKLRLEPNWGQRAHMAS